VDQLEDTDIDLKDNPEATPEMFAKAVLRIGRLFNGIAHIDVRL
jgi:hypothetical protein